MNHIPWVEKYRPNHFDKIVLSNENKVILSNIVKNNHFPNLLFYGPPGTGKTTTIINLISSYHKTYNQESKGLVIHLNASDDRGIDIIRNQIQQFVNSKCLFSKGLKFVILDEVDYMTKNAQCALKYVLQQYTNTVRFCLICNYISRIDDSLQNEFIRLRFNQLPKDQVINFMHSIVEKEQLKIKDNNIISLQELFKSDVRSMINFLQLNQDFSGISKNKIYEEIFVTFAETQNHSKCINYIQLICKTHTIEQMQLFKDLLYYIFKNKIEYITSEFLDFYETLLHSSSTDDEFLILNYFVEKLVEFLKIEK